MFLLTGELAGQIGPVADAQLTNSRIRPSTAVHRPSSSILPSVLSAASCSCTPAVAAAPQSWTRLAIVSFADDSPDRQATQDRLLANQTEIGNTVKPYYGDDAGNKLTALLQQHIVNEVGVLKAAKTGNPPEVDQAKAAFMRTEARSLTSSTALTLGTGHYRRCRT